MQLLSSLDSSSDDWTLPAGQTWPTITVVTPSLNQGPFLEELIRSVLLQGYPRLEFIIIDGGSRDQSCDIIRKYESRLAHWVSEPDRGQSDAINKGFRRATGDLIAWQNADDFYYPGAFRRLALASLQHPDSDIFYGQKDVVDEQGKFIATAPCSAPTFVSMIGGPCIQSEVTFFRKRVFESGMSLDESFHYFMDFEFFWRLLLAGFRFKQVEGIRAGFRQHPGAKSSRMAETMQCEAFRIYHSALRSTRLPASARSGVLTALLTECKNDFGNYRFKLFRSHAREALGLPMPWRNRLALIGRYCATLIGPGPIGLVKRLAGVVSANMKK